MVHTALPNGMLPTSRRDQNAISAGSSVSVANAPISVPAPEITPSSATPTNSVGTKAKKPIAVVVAETTSEGPTSRTDSVSARSAEDA